MAKRKTKKQATTRENRDEPFKTGDFCYYLTSNNKVSFAEVISVIKTKETTSGIVYTLHDQIEWKYVTIDPIFVNDNETFFKRKKRQDLIKEKNNDR